METGVTRKRDDHPSTDPESSTKKAKAGTETPTWLLDVMKQTEIEGYNATLIMQEKVITKTDLKQSEARLLLPRKQVLNMDTVLRKEEALILKDPRKGVKVAFLATKEAKYDLDLKKWGENYVLTSAWKVILKEKPKVFKVGSKYQVWSFRSAAQNNILYFVLVPIQNQDPVASLISPEIKSGGYDHTEIDFNVVVEESQKKSDQEPLPPDLGPLEETKNVIAHFD